MPLLTLIAGLALVERLRYASGQIGPELRRVVDRQVGQLWLDAGVRQICITLSGRQSPRPLSSLLTEHVSLLVGGAEGGDSLFKLGDQSWDPLFYRCPSLADDVVNLLRGITNVFRGRRYGSCDRIHAPSTSWSHQRPKLRPHALHLAQSELV